MTAWLELKQLPKGRQRPDPQPDRLERLNDQKGADAGQTWKTDRATFTSGQTISASRHKARGLEVLVVADYGVLQS